MQNMKKGSIGIVGEGLARSRKQLNGSQFDNIDSRFRTQQIELKTIVMATSDLEKYHKVCCPQCRCTGCNRTPLAAKLPG